MIMPRAFRMIGIGFVFAARVFSLAEEDRPTLKFENDQVAVVVDLGGGSISEYRLKANGLNPLQWDSWSFNPSANEEPPMDPRPMGHFLCLDRWGSASEAEKARGFTNHGEATQVWWKALPEPVAGDRKSIALMRAELPMAGIHVERCAIMESGSPVVLVKEMVTNKNPFGRIYNIVQHPTIGPPFLDEYTIVDSNGTRGFMQERPMPNPEETEARWPQAFQINGTEVDLRFLQDDPSPNVVSFIVEEDIGWVTATSPDNGLLLGYIWKTEDYPWGNIWRHVKDGKPFARGLEFGTSGLHRPGYDLVAKGRIFDRPLYRYIDADEKQSFTYAMFLAEIPGDFAGVASVAYTDSEILILEEGDQARQVSLGTFEMFPDN